MDADYIGHHSCEDCLSKAGFQLLPCHHTSCIKHVQQSGSCGTCGEEVTTVQKINPNRKTDPLHEKNYTWTIDNTRNPFSLNDIDELTAARETDDTTPTPASMRNKKSSNKSGATQNPLPTSRYVPPMLRSGRPENERPSSSISNKSFASQPPSTPNNKPSAPSTGFKKGSSALLSGSSSLESGFAGGRKSSGGFNSMNSGYRFGPGQLNNQGTSYDPFTDTSRRPTHEYVPNADAARRAPYSNSSTGTGFTFRGFNEASSQSSYQTSSQSSRQLVPSTYFNPAPGTAVKPRNKQLAEFVMSGATDDPDDIDYGNPGRSKKLPREEGTGVPKMPMPKGKVAPGLSNAMVPYNELESNVKGNPIVYLGKSSVPPPGWLHRTTSGYTPYVEDVLDALPMIEACRMARASTAGVIKLTNIPYACSRTEIVAFLGKNAQIVNQPATSIIFYGVHVMMDRHTAKTLDAYIEVTTPKEAVMITNQFNRRTQRGGHVKLGDRDIGFTVISQAEFMAELFPRAKNVVWHGTTPVISQDREEVYPGKFTSGFQGFLQDEELNLMIKHADTPLRSPFAARVPIRTFEALITLIHKYPWYAVDHVLLEERHRIFETTYKNIRALVNFLSGKEFPVGSERIHPTISTLQEIVIAALTCPGFSEGMKASIVCGLAACDKFRNVLDMRSMNFRVGGIDTYSGQFPFHALVKKPGVDDRLMKYIAGVFRSATCSTSQMSLAELQAMQGSGATPPLFGKIKVDYKDVETLGQLGRRELAAIEAALARILPRDRTRASHPGSSRKSSQHS